MNEIPAGEFQRVSTELGEAKAMLREERSKREADLNTRLAGIERVVESIDAKLNDYNTKKVGIETFERLEDKVNANGTRIAIGVGIAITISACLPFLIRILWH